MDDNLIHALALKIESKIIEEFKYIHVTFNLADTIKVEKTPRGWKVFIPAEIYDIRKWYDEGVIVYTGEGSYAEAVNQEGGFSHTHKGYIEDCINYAIQEWMKENNIKGVVR